MGDSVHSSPSMSPQHAQRSHQGVAGALVALGAQLALASLAAGGVRAGLAATGGGGGQGQGGGVSSKHSVTHRQEHHSLSAAHHPSEMTWVTSHQGRSPPDTRRLSPGAARSSTGGGEEAGAAVQAGGCGTRGVRAGGAVLQRSIGSEGGRGGGQLSRGWRGVAERAGRAARQEATAGWAGHTPCTCTASLAQRAQQRSRAAGGVQQQLALHWLEPKLLEYLPGGQAVQASLPASSVKVPLGLHPQGPGGVGLRGRLWEGAQGAAAERTCHGRRGARQSTASIRSAESPWALRVIDLLVNRSTG